MAHGVSSGRRLLRRFERRGPGHSRGTALGGDHEGHLAARFVDHLVTEHRGTARSTRCGGVPLVGVEDHLCLVVIVLPRTEHLVGGIDLAGVQHPLSVESECRRALRRPAERLDVPDLQVRAVDGLEAVCARGHEDRHEDVVVGIAAVVPLGLLPHHQRAHVDAGHEIGGAEDEGLDARAGRRDLVDVRQPQGILDLRFDPDPPDLESMRLLHLGEQQIERLDVARVRHLGQQDRVEVRTRAADDGGHIAIGASVVQSLTRTTFSWSPQPSSFSASTMVVRACSLASGDTASSRSRKSASAGRPFALSIILRLLPGTARTDRRGLNENDMG